MPRAVLLAALLLAGCAASAPRESEPLPQGVWRGTMAADGGLRAANATLYGRADGLELVLGPTRVVSDQATFSGGRLTFRAPDFPVRVGTQTLRCDLRLDGYGDLDGTCTAGSERYRLALSQRPL